MFGFIYITTNLVNGKKYLGLCRYDKVTNHKTYLGSGKAIVKAIKKYGKENFSREIIQECETFDELVKTEIELIAKYNCVEDRNWYNISSGGYSSRGFTGKKHSEETKEKMRANYKRVLTEDGKRRIAEGAKKRIGVKRKSPSKPGRVTPCIVDGISYPSYAEASRQTGLTRGQIINHPSIHNRPTKEEIYKKVSESLKGVPKTEEHRKNISVSKQSRANPPQ